MKKLTVFAVLLLLLFSLQSLVASVNTPSVVSPTVIPFLLDESGENFCTGTGVPFKGYGVAILSADSTKLSVFVSHNVVFPTAAHVHFAATCFDGDVTFPFSSPASPISQVFNVTPSDVADLFGQFYYVNIHTAAFPSGAIRGQIVPTPIRLIFALDEAQEVPPTGSFANGCGVAELSSDGTQLSVSIEHDVQSATGGDIHLAPPGVDGGMVFSFADANSPINEVWSIDTVSVKSLLNSQLYANIHSTANSDGEVRGQFKRDSVVFNSLLDGAQANGGAGTGSTAVGFAVWQLSADQSQLTVYVEHDIASPTDGHIHYGVPGVEGPIAYGFTSAASPISETWNLDPDDVDSLLNNGLYVNIHTAAFPSGEIRGQIEKEPIQFSFVMDQSQENLCAGSGSTAIGVGQSTLKPFGKEMTISATHNVSSASGAHIHQAPACADGGIVFTLGTASPINGFWYLTRTDIINYLQKELYLNIHSTPFPDGAIRSQLLNTDCCAGIRGDANYDGINANILDLNYMVNRIFRAGPPYLCLEEADANSNGTAGNIVDLNFLVNRIFRGGPAPGPCPL